MFWYFIIGDEIDCESEDWEWEEELSPSEPAEEEMAERQAKLLLRRQRRALHLGNLGGAYDRLGQIERGIEHHMQALAISREVGDRQEECMRLGNLGTAYMDLGQTERGIEHHTQALAISREVGNRQAEGHHLNNLGNAYLYGLNDPAAALPWLQQARSTTNHRDSLLRHLFCSSVSPLGTCLLFAGGIFILYLRCMPSQMSYPFVCLRPATHAAGIPFPPGLVEKHQPVSSLPPHPVPTNPYQSRCRPWTALMLAPVPRQQHTSTSTLWGCRSATAL